MKFTQFGKYTIIKKIASGGMADIFLAANLNPAGLSRFVVIKRVLDKYSENEEFKDMFKNEGKVACSLKHRSIAPIYEFGIENRQLYLAMEYISGINLRELLTKTRKTKQKINIPNAIYMIKEATSGLSYAHNAIDPNTGQPLHLIHRDVSPQNVMLSFDGEIRLIDFGISKVADTDLTKAGHLKGKFSYMSPEQARGEKLDPRTDVFCLGIILWELLTGERLFSAKNEIDALKKIKSFSPTNIRKINSSIPQELADIVMKTLQPNKNLRFETASELEKELSTFLNKTYPEFSQYNFMSFVRDMYSKELIDEREKLKNYSQKLKTHINSLSDGDFEAPIQSSLDLPDMDSSNLMDTVTKEAENTGHSKSKKSSTIIISEDSEQITHTEKADNRGQMSQTLKPTGSFDVEEPFEEETSQNMIVKDRKALLHEYASRTTKSTISNTTSVNSTISKNTGDLQPETQIMVIKNVISIILLIAFCGGGWFLFQNKDQVIHSSLLNGIFKSQSQIIHNIANETAVSSPEKPEQNRNTSSSSMKKVLIKTHPSGVHIYINNKYASTSPSIVEIPKSEPVSISLQKPGYFNKSFQNVQGDQLNNSITIELKKAHIKKRNPAKIIVN